MIKVIALDIYGTILATDDPENLLLPRKGFSSLVAKCKSKDIKIVSTSDAFITNVQIDLSESKINLSIFDKFYMLNQSPFKNFSQVVKDYHIQPQELLVIGDSAKDINGAKTINSQYYIVPEYRTTSKEFDLSVITSLL